MSKKWTGRGGSGGFLGACVLYHPPLTQIRSPLLTLNLLLLLTPDTASALCILSQIHLFVLVQLRYTSLS